MFEKFEDIKGQTCVSITRGEEPYDGEFLLFRFTSGVTMKMQHEQDCCECVYIESVVGDLDDLIGEPLLMAEESKSNEWTEDEESQTWTFYKLATRKGYVDIRWFGSSNGYYSESASCIFSKE